MVKILPPQVQRLTLLPQGLPERADARERCMALLLRAGADTQRLIDGQGLPLERFARHIGKIAALRGPATPLVVLTQTNPIALAVLHTRRVLADAVPELERAPWIVFHDESADPFFPSAALASGSFDVDYQFGPIWLTAPGHRFLVLSSDEGHLEFAPARLAALELLVQAAAGGGPGS